MKSRRSKRNRNKSMVSSKDLIQIVLMSVFWFWLLLVWITIKTI